MTVSGVAKHPQRTGSAAPSRDAVIELRDVHMAYGDAPVLNGVDMETRRGEMLALLGPSGSGKTTILRIIGGFLRPTRGSVWLSGREVTTRPPHKRGVGLVFQGYALFPHLSVEENVAYGLRVRRLGRDVARRRAREVLELVRLDDLQAARPHELSGGQQQRVALARALAIEPAVLLLDEPLSNLDANLRRDVGEEIRRLQQATETTAVMVTHDRQDAFGMADRIAVLRDGRIQQVGSGPEIYSTPNSPFMAEFSGPANILSGRVVATSEAGCTVEWCGAVITARGSATPGTGVQMLVRPEDVRLLGSDEAADNTCTARLVEAFYYGNFTSHTLAVDDCRVVAHVPGTGGQAAVGTQVRMGFSTDAAYVLPEST